ncbi:MAG: HIT domain-containing protein [Desulfurococcaceae archaeon]
MPKPLWNPWRFEYVRSASKAEVCLFCALQRKEDEEALIVHRGRHSFVVMNAFPYNTGHLMIAPYRHVGSLEALSEEELSELVMLVAKSLRVLRVAFNPDGFNVGVNIGRAAGAGVPDHVHVHVVPRWTGDNNFIAVLTQTKTLPMALEEAYRTIRGAWEKA